MRRYKLKPQYDNMKLHSHCNTELSWHIHVDPKHKRLACTGCKHIMCYYCVAASWLCTAHAHAHGQVASRVGHLQGRKLWNDVMQMVQIVTQSVLYMVWLPYTTTRLLWILCSINVYVYIYINSNEQLVHALTYSIFHTNTIKCALTAGRSLHSGRQHCILSCAMFY